MSRIATAAVSEDAARVGARIAREGGNAVDAALASALASVVTHPGMCSLGGGGFVTIWAPGDDPVVVDGGHEMPGRGLPPDAFGTGRRVQFDYAGGVDTVVGPGSVATPGLLAACETAHRLAGRLPWAELLGPSVERARDGFPMPASSRAFLRHAAEPVYDPDPRSRRALRDADGRLLEPGATVRVEGLEETLRTLAREGADAFYRGELGQRVVEHLRDHGGILTAEDLRTYRAEVRPPLRSTIDGWEVANPPAPAVGGAVVAAMAALMGEEPSGRWSGRAVLRLVTVQEAVLAYRQSRLFDPDRRVEEIDRLLELSGSGEIAALRESASTLHTSAVGSDGTACSITFSDGYGSGVVPPGTGMWMNNALGELALTGGSYHGLEPGARLASNMTPAIARSADGGVLAVGSPGAERIPTAVFMVLLNRLRLGMELERAVEHPRLHVETDAEGSRVVCEPGLPTEEVPLPVRRLAGPHMSFGGVAAAERTAGGDLRAAGDSRRSGGAAVGGDGTGPG